MTEYTPPLRIALIRSATQTALCLAALALLGPVFALGTWYGQAMIGVVLVAGATTIARARTSSPLVSLWVAVLAVVGAAIAAFTVAMRGRDTTGSLAESVVSLLAEAQYQIAEGVVPLTASPGLMVVLVTGSCLIFVLIQLLAGDLAVPAVTGIIVLAIWAPAMVFDQTTSPLVVALAGTAFVTVLASHRGPAARRGLHPPGPETGGIAAVSVVVLVALIGAFATPFFLSQSSLWATQPSLMNIVQPGVPSEISGVLDTGVPNLDRSKVRLGAIHPPADVAPDVVRSYAASNFDGRSWHVPDFETLPFFPVDLMAPSSGEAEGRYEIDLEQADRTYAPIPVGTEVGFSGLGGTWQYSPDYSTVFRQSTMLGSLRYSVDLDPTVLTADELRAAPPWSTEQFDASDTTFMEVTYEFAPTGEASVFDVGEPYQVIMLYHSDGTESTVGISPPFDDKGYSTDSPEYTALSSQWNAAIDANRPPADGPWSGQGATPEELTLPADIDPAIAQLAAQITDGAETDYDKALLLQNYFRGNGFVYDKTIPVVPDGVDPLTSFLTAKRGYCTQFATSMIMMARSLDLPARLGVGYLVSSAEDDGWWRIGTEGAHAWPEIAFPGYGWVRFEPTPSVGSGAPPSYAPDEARTPSPSPSSSSATPTPSASRPPASASAPSSATSVAVGRGPAPTATYVMWAISTIIVLAVIGVVLWRRRRNDPVTANPSDAAWERLRRTAVKAGLPWPPSATPRSVVATLTPLLQPEAAAALTRIAQLVEAERYWPPNADLPATDLESDADLVMSALSSLNVAAPESR